MRLDDYIKDIGVDKFCDVYSVSNSQAYKLMKFEHPPDPKLALKIVKVTHGLVSWAEIYESYFEFQAKAGAQLEFDFET